MLRCSGKEEGSKALPEGSHDKRSVNSIFLPGR